jgi:hypothetical protein
VKVRRTEYFERVDRLQALGQSTLGEAGSAPDIRRIDIKLCRGGEALDEVARFLRHYGYSTNKVTAANSHCCENKASCIESLCTKDAIYSNEL